MIRLTLLASAGFLAASASAAQPLPLEQLGWLRGCWHFDSKSGRYEEVWLKPAHDQMHGLSRRVGHDGHTREFEYLRVIAADDGAHYVAQPSGNPPTHFKLAELKEHRAVFKNPHHDFPQTITYEFTPPSQLLARIEGPVGDTRKTIDFPMKRQACP